MDDKYYERKGKKYTRVTSVLNIISKPWLHLWYGKLGTKECKRVSAEAMETGSQIHYFLEGWFSQSDWDTRECEGEHKDRVGKIVKYFVEHGLKPIESELTLFSDELMCAGTTDLVLEDKNGDIYILDYKSGHKGETDILQIAAYRDFYLLENSLNCWDKQIHGILCYTGKNPGDKVEFVEYDPFELEEAFKIFKHAHAIHCYLKGDANED